MIHDAATLERTRRFPAEVCVIGSGAGGAVVAQRLARAGRHVVVLEEGPRVDRREFRGRPLEAAARLYRNGGATYALGRPIIPVPLGCTLGGTTTINSGTCLRAPDEVLREWGWAPEALAPYYREIEERLEVAPVPDHLLGGNIAVFRRGLDRLGLTGHPLLRNASKACRGSGVCCFGCPTDAKRAMHLTYIPDAQQHGAQFITRCRAERLVGRGDRVAAVLARNVQVEAETVVLAAGAIHTPALLAAHGVRHVGGNLSLHPATRVAAFFEEVVDGHRGVPQSYAVDHWAQEGIILESIHGPPLLIAPALPVAGSRLGELLCRIRHIAVFGAMVRDTSRGHVRRGAWIFYQMNQADAERLRRAIVLLARIFLAAGAREVYAPIRGAPLVRTEADLQRLERAPMRPSDLEVMAFHPLGTCALGSALHSDGRVPGFANLYVADGSILPGPPGVNPQETIMALAARVADAILERRS